MRDDVFRGAVDGQTAVSVTDSTAVSILDNTITLPGTSAATVGVALANPAGGAMVVAALDNRIATGAGRGLGLTAGDDAKLQVLVQGNDLHGNAVGVVYSGAGGATLGSDLGGGPLGGLGGNNFRGFTAPATGGSAAVALQGAGSGAALHAEGNLFAAGVAPSSVVSAAARTSVDVGAPLSAVRSFVQTLYTGLLGRAGTLAELDGWAAVYNSSGQGAVAAGILRSGEALGRVVDGLYLRYLGRAADAAGRGFWVKQLQGGEALEDVEAGFLASPEFQASSNTDFVQALYLTVLGRTGSAQELAFWNSRLPQLGLAGVAAAFTHSAENRARFVVNAYQTFLHRAPSAGEVNGWLSAPGDLLAVEQGILSSPEFFANG